MQSVLELHHYFSESTAIYAKLKLNAYFILIKLGFLDRMLLCVALNVRHTLGFRDLVAMGTNLIFGTPDLPLLNLMTWK